MVNKSGELRSLQVISSDYMKSLNMKSLYIDSK